MQASCTSFDQVGSQLRWQSSTFKPVGRGFKSHTPYWAVKAQIYALFEVQNLFISNPSNCYLYSQKTTVVLWLLDSLLSGKRLVSKTSNLGSNPGESVVGRSQPMEELKVRRVLLGIRAVCTGVKVPYRFNSDASYRPGRLIENHALCIFRVQVPIRSSWWLMQMANASSL